MIQTNNMYYASFILTEGLEVCGAEVVNDEKFGHTVKFSFKGKDEKSEKALEKLYKNEEAFTNIRLYLNNLILIRDIMHGMMSRAKNEERNILRESACRHDKWSQKITSLVKG